VLGGKIVPLAQDWRGWPVSNLSNKPGGTP
jgi:hypothetical protein